MVVKEEVPRDGSKVPITHHLKEGDILADEASVLKLIIFFMVRVPLGSMFAFGKYLELLANIWNHSQLSAVPIRHFHFDLSLAIEGDPCSSSSNSTPVGQPLVVVVHIDHVAVGVVFRIGPGDRLRSISSSNIDIKVDSGACVYIIKPPSFARNLPGCPDIKGVLTVP